MWQRAQKSLTDLRAADRQRRMMAVDRTRARARARARVCVCVCVCVCAHARAGRRGQCSVLTICEAVSAEWIDLEWFWGYQTCGGGGMGERGGIVSNHVRVCVLGYGVYVRPRAPSGL